jgi:hypothetical protein
MDRAATNGETARAMSAFANAQRASATAMGADASAFGETAVAIGSDATSFGRDRRRRKRRQRQINYLGRREDEFRSGIAMSLSIENPDLVGNEKFGIAANWGSFENANGLGVSLMGVLGHNFFVKGDRAAISGGIGVGFDEGTGDDVYGGRIGIQWTR